MAAALFKLPDDLARAGVRVTLTALPTGDQAWNYRVPGIAETSRRYAASHEGFKTCCRAARAALKRRIAEEKLATKVPT